MDKVNRYAMKAKWHDINMPFLEIQDEKGLHKYMQPNIGETHDITIEGDWTGEEQPFWVFYDYIHRYYSDIKCDLFDDIDTQQCLDAINYSPITFFLCEKQFVTEIKREENDYTRLNVKVLDTLTFASFLSYPAHEPRFCNFLDIFKDKESCYNTVGNFLYISYFCQGYAYEYCIQVNKQSITIVYEYEFNTYYLDRDYCFVTNYEMELPEEIKNWWLKKGLICLKNNKMYL